MASGQIPNHPAGHNAKRVYHYVLRINTSRTDPFYVTGGWQKNVDPNDIDTYVQQVATHQIAPPTKRPKPIIPASPYDMPVQFQCWVVVQLDPALDGWQFVPGDRAAIVKDSPSIDDNINLKHVEANGDIGNAGFNVKRDKCQVFYFGVKTRGKHDTPEAHSFLTIITEYVTDLGTNLERRLSVIFDPDVPDDGDPIPP
jgi:hypothetical protein